MAPVENSRSRKRGDWYRQADPEIPDYGQKTLDDQVVSLSRLISRHPEKAICSVWSQLDWVGRGYVMMKLGCFAGASAPQLTHENRTHRMKQFLEELKAQRDELSRYAEERRLHEQRVEELGFSISGFGRKPKGSLGSLGPALNDELARLTWAIEDVSQRFIPRTNWDVEQMIEAQVYVDRRLEFLGVSEPARLSAPAIAQLFEIVRVLPDYNGDYDAAENIRKAIEHFRAIKGNQFLPQQIESRVPWNYPPYFQTGDSASYK